MSEEIINKDTVPGPLSPLGREPESGAEFYIGWMGKAPEGFAKHVKRVLFILFPAALIIGLILASFQKKFSNANFEFGKTTEVKGIYFNKPVQVIKVRPNPHSLARRRSDWRFSARMDHKSPRGLGFHEACTGP